jgi:hypothetical protein
MDQLLPAQSAVTSLFLKLGQIGLGCVRAVRQKLTFGLKWNGGASRFRYGGACRRVLDYELCMLTRAVSACARWARLYWAWC